MPDRGFKPGFRLSTIDLAILAVMAFGATVTIVAGGEDYWSGLVVVFVVLHFFLFCNVFRITRPPELVWAAVFVLCAGATVLYGFPGWIFTVLASLSVTVFVIRREIGMPWYHGICWQRWNPALPDWWESHVKMTRTERE